MVRRDKLNERKLSAQARESMSTDDPAYATILEAEDAAAYLRSKKQILMAIKRHRWFWPGEDN